MLGINNPWVIAAKWEGYFAQRAGLEISDNPHTDELISRLWASGFNSAKDGKLTVSGNFECYWFKNKHDDSEPFSIYYGCAFLGHGQLVAKTSTLSVAKRLIPQGERIYCVHSTDYPELFKLEMVAHGKKSGSYKRLR